MIRRFFWGALDKRRYLAYIAWDKITLPLKEGGLAIRELERVNDALMMKALWKVASGTGKLWVRVVLAKYLPRSQLWSSKRNYRCTVFWKGILGLREKLKWLVQWKLGDGETCRVWGQPWFQGVLDQQSQEQSTGMGHMVVRELVNENTGQWEVSAIANLFGYSACMSIMSEITPPRQGAGDDTLIFKLTVDGSYSVKKVYNYLTETQQLQRGGAGRGNASQNSVWNIIWKEGNVQPRIRVFLWKVVQNGLPLQQVLARRLATGDPTCSICGEGVEDTSHMLFRCTFARACWFAGPLAVKSEFLSTDIKEALVHLHAETTKEEWTGVVNSLWAIWKCRNECMYGGSMPTFPKFQKFLRDANTESMLAVPKIQSILRQEVATGQVGLVRQSTHSCFSDGSWKDRWQGGIGFVISKGSELVQYRSAGVMAATPVHAEAKALSEAMEQVLRLGISACDFYTDNQYLADICTNLGPPIHADWTAAAEILKIWTRLKENGDFKCHHIDRSLNEMADVLARKSRLQGWDYIGFTYPLFL